MDPWRKNLAILGGTQFLAMMGMNLVVPFLPFYVRQLGVTNPQDLAMWSGFAFSGTFLSAFLATPFWGMLGDRYGRKPMVVRAIWGLALSQILIGLAQSPLQLVMFRIVQGVISGFIASSLALVSTNTPREKIGYAIGMLQATTAAGMVLGPFIGGVLADLIGYREIFFVTAALCGIGGIVVVVGVREIERASPEARAYSVIDNYRLMLTDRRLRIVALGLVLSQMSVLMVEPIFALFVESFQSGTEYLATLAGAIFSIAGLFMVISAPWWGWRNDRTGYRKNLTLAVTVVGVAYAGHALVTNLAQLSVLRAFLGFFRGGILPGLYALTSSYAPAERRGGMMAIASSLTLLGNMFGPTVGGFIAGRAGMTAVFVVNCVMLLVLAAVLWRNLENDTPVSSAVGNGNTGQDPQI
jgi:DHA1 family multidrug resistance protein-like MFS transporter